MSDVFWIISLTLYSETNYPFSTREYRDELRHTLWIMPGVREANAFEKLLKEHPVFGMDYKIVNVVRNDKSDNILDTSGDDLSKGTSSDYG